MPDQPGFLQGLTEQPDGSLGNDILRDQDETEEKIEKTPESSEQQPTGPTGPTGSAPTGATGIAPTGGTGSAPTGQTGEEKVYDAIEILKKKPEERTQEEIDELKKHPEVLTPEQKKQLEDEATEVKKKEEEQKKNNIDPTKAIEKVKEETQNLSKIEEAKRTELQKAIGLALKYPLIKVEVPDVNKYYEKNDEGEENFNVASYMKDYTQSLIMAIQHSIVGGPLSASVFGILQQAIKDDTTEMTINSEADKEATSILNKLKDDFPRLKTDQEAENDLDILVAGAWKRRVDEAKAKNEQPVKFTYEDIKNIALRLFGKKEEKQTKPQIQDPTERIPSSPQLSPREKTGSDEVLDDIAGMKKVGNPLSF